MKILHSFLIFGGSIISNGAHGSPVPDVGSVATIAFSGSGSIFPSVVTLHSALTLSISGGGDPTTATPTTAAPSATVSSTVLASVTAQAPRPNPIQSGYVAFGDSFAAGLGTGDTTVSAPFHLWSVTPLAWQLP